MANRPTRPKPPRLSADERRMSEWRSCGILTVAALGVGVAVVLVSNLWHREPEKVTVHVDRISPFGNIIVPIADGRTHLHVEVILEQAGVLKLYQLDADAVKVREVESQVRTAYIGRVGAGKGGVVHLLPAPRFDDGKGRTSRFFVTLPEHLWSVPVTVTVPDFTVGGKGHTLDFVVEGFFGHTNQVAAAVARRRDLYSTPGGKYTVGDIRANGTPFAYQKYDIGTWSHEARPPTGTTLCPVTRTKANPSCSWVVSDTTYKFCCPPCINEFVRLAKDRPEEVKPAEYYVQK